MVTGQLKVFGNTLAELDHSIGQIVDALDVAGVGPDTLVLLAADNGPADLASVACDAIGSPGPYVGAWQKSASGGGGGSTAKTTTWEGGHRVVGMARWPGRIPANTTSHALASTLDYMPTLVATQKQRKKKKRKEAKEDGKKGRRRLRRTL